MGINTADWPIYRVAYKSLARPGRKQARKHVSDARDFNNIETRAVIKFFFFLQGKAPKEIHAILTETLACFLPGRDKDLSATMYSYACQNCKLWPNELKRMGKMGSNIYQSGDTKCCGTRHSAHLRLGRKASRINRFYIISFWSNATLKMGQDRLHRNPSKLIIQSGPKKCIHSLLINIFGINLNEISISGWECNIMFSQQMAQALL